MFIYWICFNGCSLMLDWSGVNVVHQCGNANQLVRFFYLFNRLVWNNLKCLENDWWQTCMNKKWPIFIISNGVFIFHATVNTNVDIWSKDWLNSLVNMKMSINQMHVYHVEEVALISLWNLSNNLNECVCKMFSANRIIWLLFGFEVRMKWSKIIKSHKFPRVKKEATASIQGIHEQRKNTHKSCWANYFLCAWHLDWSLINKKTIGCICKIAQKMKGNVGGVRRHWDSWRTTIYWF